MGGVGFLILKKKIDKCMKFKFINKNTDFCEGFCLKILKYFDS
jgi:hypothetical protein